MKTFQLEKLMLTKRNRIFLKTSALEMLKISARRRYSSRNTSILLFFYILAIDKESGTHEIDFKRYIIEDYSIIFIRPSQVHQQTLKAESTGYLIKFKTDFYYPHDKAANHHLRKASNKNFCYVGETEFKKL